jgi:hypothetical protein
MTTNTFQEPPLAGTEAELFLGVLDRTRSVLAWKCGGLSAEDMRVTIGASVVTLGGLMKHMTRVEEDVFQWRIFGRRPASPWDVAEQDVEWTTAAEDSPEELFAMWEIAVERSRASVAEALTGGDMGQPIHLGWDGQHANLRRVIGDLIDEYARHNGHADLIRESIDGLVGEDPPATQGE